MPPQLPAVQGPYSWAPKQLVEEPAVDSATLLLVMILVASVGGISLGICAGKPCSSPPGTIPFPPEAHAHNLELRHVQLKEETTSHRVESNPDLAAANTCACTTVVPYAPEARR